MLKICCMCKNKNHVIMYHVLIINANTHELFPSSVSQQSGSMLAVQNDTSMVNAQTFLSETWCKLEMTVNKEAF